MVVWLVYPIKAPLFHFILNKYWLGVNQIKLRLWASSHGWQ